jgi:hypothetical protein
VEIPIHRGWSVAEIPLSGAAGFFKYPGCVIKKGIPVEYGRMPFYLDFVCAQLGL